MSSTKLFCHVCGSIPTGIHAREWISVAATTYVMGQMIENYNQNKALVDSFEWYFLPVANPDGYAYTHTQA